MPLPITLLAAAFAVPAQGPVDFAKTPTAYVLGYSHLDTEWCWTYRHSILDCIPKTLRENFALFEKYPDYVFNWTGAKRYQFMKEYYPAEYARLKEYVAKGQWVVTGSGWDECDASVPAPESIIRQVLYSNRFFKREFGKTSNNYLVPDVFGFPASLPTILAHAGLKGMSTCKLTYGAGAAVPIPFNVGNWVGPDGSSIVAALNCQSYHTRVKEDLTNSKALADRIADTQKKSGLALDYTYYGLGDEGGSPEPESVQWVEASKKGTGPIKIVSRGADEMFDVLTVSQRKALPSYEGDLLLTQHSAGTATSGAAMKKLNHRNELQADAAERAAVAASLLAGARYPQARLTDAWERFLGGQMHDILPGTSIPQAYTFAWNDQIVALNETAGVLQKAVSDVAAKMDTRAKGTSVVVYNPLSLDREDIVEANYPLRVASVRVFGPDGKEVPAQLSGGKLLFLAKVPSLGFASFDVRPGPIAKSGLKVSPTGLENDRYRVRVDANGDVASVFDKKAGKELLSSPARLAFTYQKPQRHPAWNMDWTDQQKPPSGYVDGPAKVTVTENGPARVALRIEREARGSKFVQEVRLAAGAAGNRVEFKNDIDWRSQECSLKAVFPLTFGNPQATYNWEVGTVQRGNNQEKLYEAPSHRWFDLTQTDGRYGVSILNEAKYGSDKPDDQTLRLTLLYTPGVRDNYQHQGTSDWGRHEILYALQGHAGDWRTGGTQDEAARLNQPLVPFQVTPHAGTLGKSVSVATVSAPNVRVAAMKKAEDSDETIVRLFELSGKATPNVRLQFARPVVSVREVNGQELAVASKGFKFDRSGVTLSMGAYQPRALTIRFQSAPTARTGQVAIRLPLDTDVTSSGIGKADGAFDSDRCTIPGDLLPDRLEVEGVPFMMGDGLGSVKNALRCGSQTITIPAAKEARRLHLVMASAAGDRNAPFVVGNRSQSLNVQAWDGFVGQWDTRQWEGAVEDEKTFGWTHKLLGITPSYVKPARIAWYADHRRLADGKDDAYHFCYLFAYALEVPAGAKSVKLPNDPNILVMAATVSTGDSTRPLTSPSPFRR